MVMVKVVVMEGSGGIGGVTAAAAAAAAGALTPTIEFYPHCCLVTYVSTPRPPRDPYPHLEYERVSRSG